MKVNIRVHLCLRGVPTIIGPLKLGTPLSGDNIHDLVLDQVRELLTADEFSDDLRRNHYLVSAKRVGERSLESDQEEWYDVYCVRAAAQSSTAGITKNELLSELREVFGLSEVKEEAVIPWKAPRVDQNEGGTRTLAENDTGVEDHSVQSDPPYPPGYAFLINTGPGSVSTSNSSGPVVYDPLLAMADDQMEKFGEAHKETEGGPTSTGGSGQSLVGVIQHKTQSLGPKSPTKSDLSRRQGTTTTQQQAPTTIASLPPIRSLHELAGGGSNHATSDTTADRAGKCQSQAVNRHNQQRTTIETSLCHLERVDSPTVGHSAEDGKTVSNVTEHPSQVEPQEQEEEGDKLLGAEQVIGQGSPAAHTSLSPSQKTQMTNGIDLPDVGTRSGVTIVPGVNSSKIHEESLQENDCAPRASSAPTPTTANVHSKGLESHVSRAKSCEGLLINESETAGAERKREAGRKEGDGRCVGEKEKEEKGRDGPSVSTLAVPRVQELRGQLPDKPKLYGGSESSAPVSEVLRRVHALEHACNSQDKPCHLHQQNPGLCDKLYDGEMVDELRRVLMIYKEEGGPLDQEVKLLILRHCELCKDRDCRVPHMAAGCPPAGKSYTQSPSLVRPESQTAPSPPPLPPRPPPSPSHFPLQDTLAPDPQSPPLSPREHLAPSTQDTADHTDSSESSNIAPLPNLQLYQPPPVAVGSVSVDAIQANYSGSLKPKSPSIHSPITLNTISDSPHHHTPLPPGPAHPNPTSIMVVWLRPQPQIESTYLEGTFGTHCQRTSIAVGTVGSPAVAQATEDVPVGGGGGEGGMPRPYLVAQSEILPLDQCLVFMSEESGRFPHRSKLPSHKVLFSRNPNVIVGSDMPLEGLEKSYLLGSGGNGRIYRYPLLNKDYAVKFTPYRASELSEWRKFDHPNVTALLMVTGLEPDNYCCQFMTLMDGNLRGMIPSGGVYSLYCEGDREKWERGVMPSVRHIVRGVVKGTAYLHENMSIQLVDLKASNILIKKRCGCSEGVFTCRCREEAKCQVKLSDFDSVQRFQSKEFLGWHQDWWPYVPLTPEECGRVMGTPGYRAPEQFMKLAPVVCPGHLLWNKCLEGPWTDIWSLGLLVLSIFLGPNTPEDRREACIMAGSPNGKGFSRKNPAPELFHGLRKTLKLSCCLPREIFSDVTNFVASCTEPDFHKRPSAMDLIDHAMLKCKV